MDRNAKPDIHRSEQGVLNKSFDETYQVLAVEQLEYDGSSLKRKVSGDLAVRQDDTTTANCVYVGKAPIGSATDEAVWQIHKIDETSGVVITWAGGGQFNQIYDNRASLTYS